MDGGQPRVPDSGRQRDFEAPRHAQVPEAGDWRSGCLSAAVFVRLQLTPLGLDYILIIV